MVLLHQSVNFTNIVGENRSEAASHYADMSYFMT